MIEQTKTRTKKKHSKRSKRHQPDISTPTVPHPTPYSPIHPVTLKPSSFNSPVNSRLTPPKREPHVVCILKLDVSSVIILLKCLVLSPADDVCVLDRYRDVSDEIQRWARRIREKDAKETSSRIRPTVPRLSLKRQTTLQIEVIVTNHTPVDPQKIRVGQFTNEKVRQKSICYPRSMFPSKVRKKAEQWALP